MSGDVFKLTIDVNSTHSGNIICPSDQDCEIRCEGNEVCDFTKHQTEITCADNRHCDVTCFGTGADRYTCRETKIHGGNATSLTVTSFAEEDAGRTAYKAMIECPSGGHCNVVARNAGTYRVRMLYGAEIHAKGATSLVVRVDTVDGSYNGPAVISCPAKHTCEITGTGTGVFSSVKIDAKDSSLLSLNAVGTSAAAGLNAGITCPMQGRCVLFGNGTAVFAYTTIEGFTGTSLEFTAIGQQSADKTTVNCATCQSICVDVEGKLGLTGAIIDGSDADELQVKADGYHVLGSSYSYPSRQSAILCPRSQPERNAFNKPKCVISLVGSDSSKHSGVVENLEITADKAMDFRFYCQAKDKDSVIDYETFFSAQHNLVLGSVSVNWPVTKLLNATAPGTPEVCRVTFEHNKTSDWHQLKCGDEPMFHKCSAPPPLSYFAVRFDYCSAQVDEQDIAAFFGTAFNVQEAAVSVDAAQSYDNKVCHSTQGGRRLVDAQRQAFSVVVQVDIDKDPRARSLVGIACEKVKGYDPDIDVTTCEEAVFSPTQMPTVSPTVQTVPTVTTSLGGEVGGSLAHNLVFLGFMGGLGGALFAGFCIGIFLCCFRKRPRHSANRHVYEEESDADFDTEPDT